jgi:hypothetical protein
MLCSKLLSFIINIFSRKLKSVASLRIVEENMYVPKKDHTPKLCLWSVARKINYLEPFLDELAIKSGNTEDYDMLCSH